MALLGRAPSQIKTDAILKERQHLETFFTLLAQFSFDKAKEVAEKEFRSNPSLHPFLSQLALAEKHAMSLLFLTSKGFFKKDISLKSQYDSLLMDSSKVEKICHDLVTFMQVRLLTVEIYEHLYSLSQESFPSLEKTLESLAFAPSLYNKIPDTSILLPLKRSIASECQILQKLVQTQLSLQRCQFLPSLMNLQAVHSLLHNWTTAMAREPRRALITGVQKTPVLPPLCQWLLRFKVVLLSKFSLYFHEVLSKQGGLSEMKNHLSHSSCTDFYHKIVSFHKKADLILVAIIYNSYGQESYRPGYRHPSRGAAEPATGIDTYPAIFCYPPERPLEHWPSLVMAMSKFWDPTNSEDMFCVPDDKAQIRYHLCRIEPDLVLVAIADIRKSEPFVTTFLKELMANLRLQRLFSDLRPSNKTFFTLS